MLIKYVEFAEAMYEKHQKEIGANNVVTLDDLFSKIESENLKQLNLIVKADVQGSVEALKQSLEKVSNNEVRVKVIHSNVGGVTESDVTLAKVSGAIIIAFNVRPEVVAKHKFTIQSIVNIPVCLINYKDGSIYAVDHREPKLKSLMEFYDCVVGLLNFLFVIV